MPRVAIQATIVSDAVRLGQRIQAAVKECLDVTPAAEVFAAVCSPLAAKADHYGVCVIPYYYHPTDKQREALENTWPGAQVSWFSRYNADADSRPNP